MQLKKLVILLFILLNYINFYAQEKKITFKFGGRVMVDHAFMNQDTNLDITFGELTTTSATEVRRARMFLTGTAYNNVTYKIDLGFEGGKVALKDVYLGLKKIPFIGNLRVGNVKEPFRFEMLTSSKYITFMERSLMSDFVPTRNNGVLLFNEFKNKRLGYQAGLFRNADEKTANDKVANNGYVFTGRATGLLIDNKEKKQLLHLGAAFSHRVFDNKEYKIASKPEAHLSSVKYINTGTIENVDNVNLLNLEFVFINGPFIAQVEYLNAKINGLQNYNFTSYYTQVSYFLTGEHKNYKSSYAGFGRLKPINNFGSENKSLGAWEIAARYSNADYNDNLLLGGEQQNITLGVNWYLNPVTKIAFNNIFTKVKDVGNASIFQVRFQIDF